MTLDRIIRLPELVEITGLSRSGLYQLIRQGRFPRPRELGRQARGWLASEIQAWMDGLPPAGPGPESGAGEEQLAPWASRKSAQRDGAPGNEVR